MLHMLAWLISSSYHSSQFLLPLLPDTSCPSSPSPTGDPSPPRASQQAGMADGRQPDEHWTSNGQENGENGYSAYSSGYRENGYHGGAAAHPGATGIGTRTPQFASCLAGGSDIDWTALRTLPDGCVGKM